MITVFPVSLADTVALFVRLWLAADMNTSKLSKLSF